MRASCSGPRSLISGVRVCQLERVATAASTRGALSAEPEMSSCCSTDARPARDPNRSRSIRRSGRSTRRGRAASACWRSVRRDLWNASSASMAESTSSASRRGESLVGRSIASRSPSVIAGRPRGSRPRASPRPRSGRRMPRSGAERADRVSRPGVVSTRPPRSSRVRASRIGVRLTPATPRARPR